MLVNCLLSIFSSKLVLSEKDKIMLHHGIDILICDGSNILCLLIIAYLSNHFLYGVLYVILFSMLRGYSGGWHSSTRLGCFIIYQIMFLLSLTIGSLSIPSCLSDIVFIFASVYTLVNLPVQHIYNPLTENERKRNMVKTRIVLFCILILYMIFVSMHLPYYRVISQVVLWNALYMEALKHTSYWRKPDGN